MRVFYISDLHLNLFNYIPRIKDYKHPDKILVLAGDIYSTRADPKIMEGFHKQCVDIFGENNIYYIKGNHEFYYDTFKKDKLIYINDKIRNVVGCTLWSDFEGGDAGSMIDCYRFINDFKNINNFSTDIQLDQFKMDVEFLTNNINEDSIVVTHHLPSFKCINKRYKYSITNGSFASDLDYLILEKKPKLWIHGHTHVRSDKKVGNTRIVCNSFGYLYRERTISQYDFLPIKWIDL